MIKKILLICFIASISYYAGSQGITPKNILFWFEEKKVTQTIRKTLNKAFELTNENMSTQKQLK